MKEEKEEKKHKKKPSKTALINNLKNKIKELREELECEWTTSSKLRRELNFFKEVIPIKFYKINFKIKANDGNIYNYEEIIEGISPKHAIMLLKNDKTHPNTFELVDIKKLA